MADKTSSYLPRLLQLQMPPAGSSQMRSLAERKKDLLNVGDFSDDPLWSVKSTETEFYSPEMWWRIPRGDLLEFVQWRGDEPQSGRHHMLGELAVQMVQDSPLQSLPPSPRPPLPSDLDQMLPNGNGNLSRDITDLRVRWENLCNQKANVYTRSTMRLLGVVMPGNLDMLPLYGTREPAPPTAPKSTWACSFLDYHTCRTSLLQIMDADLRKVSLQAFNTVCLGVETWLFELIKDLEFLAELPPKISVPTAVSVDGVVEARSLLAERRKRRKVLASPTTGTRIITMDTIRRKVSTMLCSQAIFIALNEALLVNRST